MTTSTWTPAAPVDSFPKADPITTTGSFRVYFFDLVTRQELTDHPLHGMHWTGTSSMVSSEGRYVDGTTDTLWGASFLGGKYRDVAVTPESFPGRKVCAKVWHPEHATDWRILASGDGTRVLGKPARLGREWVAQFKAGLVT